ncbi:aminotransferase class V-fold PLP-dependent enzyme [Bailinhaonella thermotolerans]|uniref:Aminotransferase class V-fold PLP-dependent enzyme n=1 Tax=Bailinhaonella thermotolerans TaxID=1070861 RepID=A0A3A4AW57_9ACTN|nr:aminotransferase class V-fold PLP-dependent enzyme [Bailinhaonella thermotolerans]RJL34460.1 aminotransferase class V-fold PLP-dependent enzyme [Bailinhaonella thermotolerans]
MDLRKAQELWDAEPGWLNTASYGLPPRPAWEALLRAQSQWRHGSTDWAPWDESTGRSRAAFARLTGAAPGDVAVASTTSYFMGLVAASLPPGARVVAPEVEFTSNLFPWMASAEVSCVPLDRLADSVDARTSLVAFSLVQSATGEIAPVEDILAAARAHGALVAVDATQAVGWLPLDATRFDVVACSAYKWLMAPRGAAFAAFSPRARELVRPLAANWYAGGGAYYGPPLRLNGDASAFDLSPAWFSFVGAAPAMELLLEIGVERIRDHNVALANRFLAGLGLPPGGSAIVSVDVPGAADRLRAAGVRAAVRAGRVRASFHVYSTEADVDLALAALTGPA